MDEERNRHFFSAKVAIQDGYESGISPMSRTVEDTMEAAINRIKVKTKGERNV
ncbi:hypothetical protein [Maribacter sp. ACAM166]|uniref:hypothetical protein n=1 Tax=Maribacter sp. ACAM166 TaxID=2508996 RepID=UPI001485976A|nr:hypothetical protein [Maribacter sp. ACAM166]